MTIRTAPATARATTIRIARVRSPGLGRSRSYMGSVMSFLVEGADTDGRFAMVEYRSKPGNEPPPHVHDWEDEFCHVLEGSAVFYCGLRTLWADAGDYVSIPRGVPHTFRVLSPELRMTIMVASTDGRPVGLDRHFVELGEPATPMDPPPDAATHATADPDRAFRVAGANGTRILSPEQAAAAMPIYAAWARAATANG